MTTDEKAKDLRSYFYTELRVETDLSTEKCLSLSKKLAIISARETTQALKKAALPYFRDQWIEITEKIEKLD